jgi:hypothetical protein
MRRSIISVGVPVVLCALIIMGFALKIKQEWEWGPNSGIGILSITCPLNYSEISTINKNTILDEIKSLGYYYVNQSDSLRIYQIEGWKRVNNSDPELMGVFNFVIIWNKSSSNATFYANHDYDVLIMTKHPTLSEKRKTFMTEEVNQIATTVRITIDWGKVSWKTTIESED